MELGVFGIGVSGGFGGSLSELVAASARGAASAPDVAPLAGRVSPAALRRMDGFTRMCLLAALRARDDSEARGAPWREAAGGRVGIVLATGFGPVRTAIEYLDSVLDHGESCASPTAFSLSVQNMPVSVLALNLGVSGPCCTVCQLDNPVLPAVFAADCWLQEGRVETVLLGAADTNAPLLDYGLPRLQAEGPAGLFLPGRGCGAVFLVLRGSASAGRPYGVLDAIGAGPEAGDALPGTALIQREGGASSLIPAFGAAPSAWAADLALACWALDGGDIPSLSLQPDRVLCRSLQEGRPEAAVLLRRPGC